MLPTGFEWQDYIDGPALYVGGRLVALCTPVANGRWRVTTGVGFTRMRHEFFDSEATAVRYVEAWGRKWQDAIRHEVGLHKSGSCGGG